MSVPAILLITWAVVYYVYHFIFEVRYNMGVAFIGTVVTGCLLFAGGFFEAPLGWQQIAWIVLTILGLLMLFVSVGAGIERPRINWYDPILTACIMWVMYGTAGFFDPVETEDPPTIQDQVHQALEEFYDKTDPSQYPVPQNRPQDH